MLCSFFQGCHYFIILLTYISVIHLQLVIFIYLQKNYFCYFLIVLWVDLGFLIDLCVDFDLAIVLGFGFDIDFLIDLWVDFDFCVFLVDNEDAEFLFGLNGFVC